MRWRVDLLSGYISYDEKEEAKARELYVQEGLRLRRCRDIHDEGEIVESVLPDGVDTKKRASA